MTCKECGVENKDDASFCANCGTRLEKPEAEHSRKCPECGFGNPPVGRFCARCGFELRQHHNGHQYHNGKHVQQRHQKKKDRRVDTRLKWHPGLVGIVLLGSVFAFIAGMELFVKKQPSPPSQLVETKSTDAKLEAMVIETASKFICSCGTCGEKPLDVCTCNRAVEERQFIRNYLEQGQKPEQVIFALNNTYGWIKPQFAGLVGDTTASKSTLKVGTPAVKPISGVLIERATTSGTSGAKLASSADRIEIFSHFNCPCGQCNVDELKECGCQHPRGATEVKAFVDVKIAEGKYTVAQLVDMIDKEYGGRKF